MYDLIIIGGGPAGTAAAVYAGRKYLKTLLVTPDFGGQSIVSNDIQNWIGNPSISGSDLAKNFKKHVETYANDVVAIKSEKVKFVEKKENMRFSISTEEGGVYESKTVLVATGSGRRKLTIPGAKEFENKGITYCASCDGPIFAGQDVVVIGGGNAGFESAAQLLAYAKSVTLLHRSDEYKADEITVQKVLNNPKMTGILNAQITKVYGNTFVQGIIYTDSKTGEEHDIKATGIFVEIGQIPNTDFISDTLVEKDEYKRFIIDPFTQQTNTLGIWAAGDCSNIKYHQNNIACGDGVRALEDIYLNIHTK